MCCEYSVPMERGWYLKLEDVGSILVSDGLSPVGL